MSYYYYAPTTSISLSPFVDSVTYYTPIISKTGYATPYVTLDPLYPHVSTVSTVSANLPYAGYPSYPSYPYPYYMADTSELGKHDINEYLRYKFLDSALVKEHKDILQMLTVKDGMVKPLPEGSTDSGDSNKDVEKKVDFIGNEILTRSKNLKILEKIVEKNFNLKFFNLPQNEDSVFGTQAKYVKQKIRELRK
jgi:hypothetical protein